MSEFRIERYRASLAGDWDAFVRASRNGTFLLERGYMDYHSDRFRDCSWVARKGNSIVALLPANLTDDGTLHSHQGLTYGGWILPMSHLDGADLLEIFRIACRVWHEAGIRELDYKPVPSVYHRLPSQEDEYALWRLGAVLTECTLDAAAYLREGVRFNTLRRRNLRRALSEGVEIREEEETTPFMEMLDKCLLERHDTHPVHTVAEMELLRERFPRNIRIFCAYLPGREGDTDNRLPDAGVCVYDTGKTAHAQYIATTPEGRNHNLLTPLFHSLMSEEFADRDYFDFGISTERGGEWLNEGLLRQKYSFGATGVACRRYRLRISDDSANILP